MTDKTIVAFLLDKSSSMNKRKAATIEAFNGYLDQQRDTPNMEFSLLQFCTNSVDYTCKNVPIKEAPELSNDNYDPAKGGSTPLIDAAVEMINAVAELVKKQSSQVLDLPDPKVVICIQTDGEENSSRKYTWNDLTALIKEKTAAGYQFNFMGADIDAYAQAAKMGLGAGQTMSYDSTNLRATKKAFSARGRATAMYASGLAATMDIGDDEKLAAGDKWFDKGAKKLADSITGPPMAAKTKKPTKGGSIVDKINLD